MVFFRMCNKIHKPTFIVESSSLRKYREYLSQPFHHKLKCNGCDDNAQKPRHNIEDDGIDSFCQLL